MLYCAVVLQNYYAMDISSHMIYIYTHIINIQVYNVNNMRSRCFDIALVHVFTTHLVTKARWAICNSGSLRTALRGGVAMAGGSCHHGQLTQL